MAESIRELLKDFLPPAAVEASFEVMGLDTRLIDDGTYFVVEYNDAIAVCGGWSRRNTLFGGDHTAARNDALLNPESDAARAVQIEGRAELGRALLRARSVIV